MVCVALWMEYASVKSTEMQLYWMLVKEGEAVETEASLSGPRGTISGPTVPTNQIMGVDDNNSNPRLTTLFDLRENLETSQLLMVN